MHVPTTALAVAKSQAALGLLVEARDTLASSMRRTPDRPTDPQPFKDARAEGDQLDASLAGRVPGLTINVKGSAEGEQPALAIDGLDVPAGTVGLPRAVDPGHHVVVAKTATAEARQEVDVREGEQKQVELMLVSTGRPAPAPRPIGPGPPAMPGPSTPVAEDLARSRHGHLGRRRARGRRRHRRLGDRRDGAIEGGRPPGRVRQQCVWPGGPHGPLLGLLGGDGLGRRIRSRRSGRLLAVGSLVVGHASHPEAPAQPPAASGLTTHLWLGFGVGGLRGTF